MSISGLILVLQAAAAQAPQPHPPDIEIRAGIRAESVEVRQEGDARIALRVDPGEAEPVRVERSAPAGQRSYRNLTVDLVAQARIADPQVAVTTETREPTGEPKP